MIFVPGGLLPVLSVCFIFLLFGKVFGYERRAGSVLFGVSAAAACAAGAASQLPGGEVSETLTELVMMACALGLPYILFVRRRRLTFVFAGLTVCSLFDFLEYAIVSLFPTVSWQKALIVYTALYAAACAAAIAAGKLLKKRNVPDFPDRIPYAVYAVIFAVNYSAYYGLTVINTSESYSGAAAAFSYISAVLSAGCIGYTVYRYAVLLHRQKEEEHIRALELMRYEEIIRNNRDLSAFRHDCKNDLHALKTLITSGRTGEAEEYIASLTDSLDKTKGKYQTGNILADAILSDKAAEAEKHGIAIEFEGIIPAEGIANRDLCAVLSNALDNAREACIGTAPCTVSVFSRAKESGMVLTVKNPVKSRVPIRGGRIITTKQDKKNHGFGLSNIRTAAERCSGYADISCDDSAFMLEVGLMFGEKMSRG